MAKTGMAVSDFKQACMFVCRGMVQSKDELTQVDKATGDGDHGVNMARGFGEALVQLQGNDFSCNGEMLETVGKAVMMKSGGAAGAIFGTWFLAGGKAVRQHESFDAAALRSFLVAGLDAVQKRGGARQGAKTMLDALQPAASALENSDSDDVLECLALAAQQTKAGAEATRDMVAAFGKAKTMGERALGHMDPGAYSTSLIMGFMHRYFQENFKG